MPNHVLAASLVALCLASNAAAETRIEKNVVYGMYSGLALLMDVYQPAQPNGIGIVFVAGSGYYAPIEFNAPALKDSPINTRFGRGLADRGYTVFAINHRATPRFQFPAGVEDVQRAVRFVRANADTYRIRGDKVGAAGGSSGGYGAAMAGVLDGTGEPDDADPVNRHSGKVQAVVALYAPFDLVMQITQSEARGVPEALLVGAWARPDTLPTAAEVKRLMTASPVTHVTADDPPFLLLHGDADTAVPMNQSAQMEAALKKAGIEARFMTVPGGRHGNNFGLQPGDPQLPDDVGDAARWFDRYLRDTPTK
jgi:acetyl esterase/lipase